MKSARDWLGVELNPVSATEMWVSLLGGLVSIGALILLTGETLGLQGAAMLISSMGASAVLLFGVPHGPLSQPWPVLAGHTLAATVGVLCARHIDNVPLAGACAVGITLGLMHRVKCIHPPGGATALTAVIGGESVRNLGFSFIWSPVLLNALIMVAIAVAFNALFRWRRYPSAWHAPREQPGTDPSHEEVLAALRTPDSFVDISEEDLLRLVSLLSKNKRD